ncbi:MAG: anhydro-N-acetylmuramic acid kinase [Chitinophagaceae bacterium]|nr:anhydro-N-acetylmuramic acid kinase [Chitinophagaceae bacterium]
MIYNAIGMMSGSSLDGLDIVYVEFQEVSGKWTFEIKSAETGSFTRALQKRLMNATQLPAREYLKLDFDFGKYCGESVNAFLKKNRLSKKTDVIGCHGHTTFHEPHKGIEHQLGNGAVMSAITKIPVVTQLRSMDVALGGQGAPIVPIGEKLLFGENRYYLNIGGIANVSVHDKKKIIAFDICAANRILNMLSAQLHKKYDKGGQMALRGKLNQQLLNKLNKQKYYSHAYPKSLPNSFGTDIIFPIIRKSEIDVRDALSTYTEHIAQQVVKAILPFRRKQRDMMVITGGGALNTYLVSRLNSYLEKINVGIVIPEKEIIEYKEALIMALMAVLRLRNENNVLSSVTGAGRNSVNGALWFGK